MLIRKFLCVLLLAGFAVGAQAQVRELPQAVKDAFAAQYAGAEQVEYKDKVVTVHVHFTLNGEHMMASYNSKGKWKETEKDWSFEQLSDEVKEGFSKSKYATDEWKVADTKVVYRPEDVELYRVKVEKNELQKKYLFFNAQGRLVDDALTL